jgi:hypothetical protein
LKFQNFFYLTPDKTVIILKFQNFFFIFEIKYFTFYIFKGKFFNKKNETTIIEQIVITRPNMKKILIVESLVYSLFMKSLGSTILSP